MTHRFVRSLDARERRRAFEHTFAAWAEGRNLDAHVAYQNEQLERAPFLEYAGLVDQEGSLLASLKRFDLKMMCSREELSTIGIGAVMVPEASRRRGLGRTLLEEALADARATGAQLAWLFSEIDPSYYEKLGFVRIDWPIFACDARELPRSARVALRVVAEPSDEDLSLVADLDEARAENSGAQLWPSRTTASRRYFAWRNGLEHVFFSMDDRDVAYALVPRAKTGKPAGKGEPNVLEIAEWAFANVDHDQTLALLGALAHARGATHVAGPLGADAVDERFARFASDAHGVPMILALDESVSLPLAVDGAIPGDRARLALSDYF